MMDLPAWNEEPVSREPRGTWRGRLVAAVVTAAWVLPCAADDVAQQDRPLDPRISTNQGVELGQDDDVAAAAAAADVDVEGGGRMLQPRAPSERTRPHLGSAAAANEPPRLVRARRSFMPSSAPSTQGMPWYRTGFGALAIVLAVVGLMYYAVRRWLPGAAPTESDLLRIAGRAALTPKHSATLIQLGRRFVLVGVSPDRVDLLCEVTEPDEVAELAARATAGTKSFDRLLATEAEGFSNWEEGEGPLRPVPSPPRNSRPVGDLLKKLKALKSRSG